MTTGPAVRAENSAEDVLRDIFEITAPLSPEALAAFDHDPLYAENLWVARHNPAFVEALLANPPIRNGVARLPAGVDAELGTSLPGGWWRKIAIGMVSQDVYEKRLAVCGDCPHQIVAVTTFQRLSSILAPAGRKSICELCGCPIANKARFAAADCPDPDPRMPELSRWRAAAESGLAKRTSISNGEIER